MYYARRISSLHQHWEFLASIYYRLRRWEPQLCERKRSGGFRQPRHFSGIHGVFQRRTKNNLWHSSLIQPATFFSSASFLHCSLFAVDLQVKRLTSPSQTLTRWASPWAHKEPASFSYSTSLTRSISVFSFVCSLSWISLFSPWYSCLPISPFPLPFFPSMPRCLHLS